MHLFIQISTTEIKNLYNLQVPLADEMFVCDALARWEKVTQKRSPTDCPLELRKKLFSDVATIDVETDSAVEDLIFSQACLSGKSASLFSSPLFFDFWLSPK